MSYPDVVIVRIEHKVSLEAFRAIEVLLVSTIIIWRIIPGGWLITITANHSNYLVCDRANTQSVTVRKVVKTATQLLQCPRCIMNLQYRPVRREERGMFIWSLLIDVYALFSTLFRRQASMTQAGEIFTLLLKSDVNLFNHLVRKADVAGCCSAGSVLRWHEVASYSVSLICIVWSCFYVKLMQIN